MFKHITKATTLSTVCTQDIEAKMHTTVAPAKVQNLLRLLQTQNPKPHLSLLLRHLSAEPNHPPPPPPPSQTPPPTHDPSPIIQVVNLLQTHENDWNNNPTLRNLLFPPPDSSKPLSPRSLLTIARRLGSSDKALKFFHYICTNSPSPPDSPSLSATFQGIFELAAREQPNSPTKLSELLSLSKDRNIPLTINSAILLIRCFGRSEMVENSVSVFKELDPHLQNTNVRNALLSVLLSSGRVDDALQVLDEMLKPDVEFPPDGRTVDVVFGELLRRDGRGRSVSEEEIVGLVLKFGEHGLFPNAVWLTQLITKLCRSWKCDQAWEVLHDVMRLGGDVEAASCNALLTGLGRKQDFERMNELLKEMKEKGIQPNVITFGILINHMCKFHRVDDALEVFKKMNDEEESNGIMVEPDVIIYNTLIDGLCKVGRQEEGLELMERMRSQKCCQPTPATYNCLIDGFCKAGEIDRSRELFNQMKKEGVPPNVITVNTLVNETCKHGRISSAMEFFNEMQGQGLKGNVITYTTLINAFCNVNNIDRAMGLFDEMLKSGCSPDSIVYYALISGLTQAGRMDEADSVAAAMRKAGFRLDIACYNTLIGGFCRRMKVDKAHELLKEMVKSGVKPDSVTYNTLISYFSKGGYFDTAHKLMKNMIKEGLVPNVVTYGALIHAYCLVGNVDEAMEIFRHMNSASRVPPNTVIYNILIDTSCKNEKVDAALSLLTDMEDKGLKPNTTTYNAIFKGLKEKNWVEKALELMNQMTEHACNPDYITMEILTEWLCAVGETDKLKRFVQGYEVFASTA